MDRQLFKSSGFPWKPAPALPANHKKASEIHIISHIFPASYKPRKKCIGLKWLALIVV